MIQIDYVYKSLKYKLKYLMNKNRVTYWYDIYWYDIHLYKKAINKKI